MRKILLASAFFAPLFFGAAHAQAPVVGPCYNGVSCDLGSGAITANGGVNSTAGLNGQPFVTPEQFGALGNATTHFDGAVATTFTGAVTQGSSTTPTAPAVTTRFANTLVVSVFAVNDTWSTTPPVANTRANLAVGSNYYGMFVGDQTVATAGAVNAISGTLSASQTWTGQTIPLQAASGQTPSFVGSGTYQGYLASGTSYSVTAPAGIQAGDVLLACGANYTNGGAHINFVVPSGFSIVSFAAYGGNPQTTCYWKVATASEPSSYTFTYSTNGPSGQTLVLLDYRGVTQPENVGATFTSVSAGFSASAVGDAICIAGINGVYFQQQSCGTITGVNSATSANLSFVLPISASGLQWAYGTSDSGAFASMLSTAPCSTVGCIIRLGPKHYALTQSLVFPPNLPVNLEGQGAAVPNTANNYTGNLPKVNFAGGTQLQWLTQSLTSAALTVGGTLHVTSTVGSNNIFGTTLLGGVGNGMDGGGSDGLAILNVQNARLDNSYVYNFTGRGVYIDGMAAGDGKDYIEDIVVNQSTVEANSVGGVVVGSTIAVNNIETVNILNSVIEGNGGPGIWVAGTNIQGLKVEGDTIQWDNLYDTATELYVSGFVNGGIVQGNYFESDGAYGSSSSGAINGSVGVIGMVIGSNWYWPLSTAFTWPTYSAATTPLPGCATTNGNNHKRATVTDATSQAIGATYTSGGTLRVDLICTGGVWTSTGTASY